LGEETDQAKFAEIEEETKGGGEIVEETKWEDSSGNEV
jgi:hypothetical protein